MKLLPVILLTLLLGPQAALARVKPKPADPPPPAEEPVPPDTTQPSEPPSDDTGTKEHRLRPKTDKDEEEYKKRVVREDPFLNAPPGPDAGDLAFYHPTDWLRFDAPLDRATYLTQDGNGKMVGFLTIAAEPQPGDPSLVHMVLDYEATHRHVELWLEKKTLRPRSVTKLAPAQQSAGPLAKREAKQELKKEKKAKGKPPLPDPGRPPLTDEADAGDAAPIDGVVDANARNRTRIDYLFDRVTIQREAGVVTTQERMRQLPYSFDIEQLPLLVRQLDFAKLDHHWPFEALLTDPEHRTSIPLQVAEPQQVSVTSAEPQKRACYELKMRLGETATWTWWVERAAPYRLVKFTDGIFTYTLHQYDAAPGSY